MRRMTCAGSEVLAGGFIGEFRELAYQFLEDGAHVRIADLVRVQVDLAELFCNEVRAGRRWRAGRSAPPA